MPDMCKSQPFLRQVTTALEYPLPKCIYTVGMLFPLDRVNAGLWGLTVDFFLIPVSAAIEWSSGCLLVWSSFRLNQFTDFNDQQTVMAVYDPSSWLVTPQMITNTGHDMFCEGLSIDADGSIVAVGGNSNYRTSIYNSVSDCWADDTVSWALLFCAASFVCSWANIWPVGNAHELPERRRVTQLFLNLSDYHVIESEHFMGVSSASYHLRWLYFYNQSLLVQWIWNQCAKRHWNIQQICQYIDKIAWVPSGIYANVRFSR